MTSHEALPPEEPSHDSRIMRWLGAFGRSQARAQGMPIDHAEKPEFTPTPSKIDQAYSNRQRAKANQALPVVGPEDTSWWDDRVVSLRVQDVQVKRYCGDLLAAQTVEEAIAQFPPERI